MVMNRNVRTVQYLATQGAEDLYRCKDNGMVYIRQECDEKYVRWLTSIKWTEGYEADCPMKEGFVFHVVDKNGGLLFREYIIRVDGYSDTVAEKVGPFSGEPVLALAEDIKKKYELADYDEWKAWLMEAAKESGFTGYYDNWLFDANYGVPVKIATLDYLGKTAHVIMQQAKHRNCNHVWTDFEIRDTDGNCLSICGYKLGVLVWEV